MTKIERVAFIGQLEYNLPFFESDLSEQFDAKVFHARASNAGFAFSTSEDGIHIDEFKPDISVFFRPEFFRNEALDRLGGIKIAISTEPFPKFINGKLFFSKDSISRFKRFLAASELNFDYILHYDESSLSFMRMMGAHVSGILPLPVATGTWKPSTRSSPRWEIAFLGRSTEHRERHFGLLKRDLRFLHIAHGLTGAEALPYYHSSIIGLNIHAENEPSWTPRLQQLMSSGLLVVSEPIPPNTFFRPGEHFIEVKSPQDTYEVCRAITSEPSRYDHIRVAGMVETQKNLSAKVIWPDLFQKCASGKLTRPRFDLSLARLEPLEVCAEFNGFDHLLERLVQGHA